MTLTSLTKQLEETFLRQLQEEELRAKRALRIFEHQQKQIRRLQKSRGNFSFCGHSETPITPIQDQNANDDLDLKRSVDLINLEEANVGVQEASIYNIPEIPVQIKHEKAILTNDEMDKIQKEMEFTKHVLLNSKRKIQNLEHMVQKIQESNSETNIKESLVDEMSTYRKTIDDALADLEASNLISDRVLKTALRFFTAQETLHVLSSLNPLPRKVSISKSENSMPKEPAKKSRHKIR